MDGDPAVESDLDGFSRTLPLPYRVGIITVLATWGWGINLQVLYQHKIDVPSLIKYPGRLSTSTSPTTTHHDSAYRLAAAASALVGASLLVFWLLSHRDPGLVIAYDWLPMATLLLLGLLLIFPSFFNLPPFGYFHKRKWLPLDGRRRLAAVLRRVVLGGLAEPQHGKFGDVLLADVLTSYSKVLGDLYVVLCMFFFREGSTVRPDRSCGGGVVVPLIMAVPFAARFRQCLIEYRRTGGRQHLANAAKYSTSFPVILFSALHRASKTANPESVFYYRLWMAACAVNSLYSFYWDVAKDWDLTLFEAASASDGRRRGVPWGLRRRLLLGGPSLYYAVMALDLVLRCTWSLKLSPHLDHVTDFESSLFVLQLLEVVRRWVWMFFRVETEWIRTSPGNESLVGSLSSGLNATDILLGDYQSSKYGSDDESE